MNTSGKIRVTILDDHQSIIDGYTHRLEKSQKIRVVAGIAFGEELEPTLAANPTDVLLLDVSVPTSAERTTPYPILHLIPHLLEVYPRLHILVISMHLERGLIRAVMEAGASGYILKDDRATIQDLENVVIAVASGSIHFSQKAHQLFLNYQISQDGESLSPRQLQALSLCAAYTDRSSEDLAVEMSVAHSTFRNLLAGAYIKLGAHTRLAAVAKAQSLGILTPFPSQPSSEEIISGASH
jgi:two-component system nitrate/nitrite response regulator NarL